MGLFDEANYQTGAWCAYPETYKGYFILVTSRYGDNYTINSEEFCVDTTNTGDVIAVACNPCQGSKVSIYRIESLQ